MSFKRYQVDLAFKQPLPPELQGQLTAIEATIRNVKAKATNINAGLPNEEDTTKAVWHICRHDTNELCDPEQDI